MDLYRYATNATRGAFHYVREVAGGMLFALCGRNADGMTPLAAAVRHTECRRCADARAHHGLMNEVAAERAAAVEAAATPAGPALYRPAGTRRRSAGHYRRPGTTSSYCGRTVEAAPAAPQSVTGVCQPCAKAEQRDRVAAEQVAADRSIDGPTLAERAGVRYALVGTGRRVHYSGNDDTLCGREVSRYTDGTDTRHPELCARCITAAEERAYARALAADSPLAAAALDLAETVEQADAEQAAEQPLVIIPCGSTKLDHAAPAADLYVGSYHRACARAAAALTANGGTVLILSALHGLVPLDRVLDPYEMRMGDKGSVTPDVLREQARALGVDTAANVTILAGLSYATPALAVWPHADAPLVGLPGMGHHMRALAQIADGEQDPAANADPDLYAPRGLGNLVTGHLLDPRTGRAYCGTELAGRNGAAVLLCAACRRHSVGVPAAVEREQHLDAAEAAAADQFEQAAHIADAVEHAEQVEAGVATVGEAVTLYDAHLAAALVDDELRHAAALVTEAEATEGTWRGEWIGDTPADETLFVAAPAVEQGALFDGRATATAPEPVVVRVSFDDDTLARIKAKADADRAAYRAETDDRIAAEHRTYGAPVPAAVQARIDARTTEQAAAPVAEPVDFRDVAEGDVVTFLTANNGYGDDGHPFMRTGTVRTKTDDTVVVDCTSNRLGATARLTRRAWADRSVCRIEQAPARPVLEGKIVTHNGTTKGSAPKHSTDPDARAALDALAALRLAEVTDHTDIAAQPGDLDHAPAAWGFLVEPRGHGRVALYWIEAGRYVRPDGEPFAVELEIGAERLRKAGWKIEAGTRRCVMAWRPE
ncbi:hypothetical protein MIU24_18915 [Streptomyces venezuelae]|uniref:DUF6884 domain-containing protein n=1 Tax=Streptomyces sp. B6(2022) TaxID=3404749 RepID=UPI00311DB964